MTMNFKEISCELVSAVHADISRSALARRMGTGLENVSRWENGSRRISWSDFAQICDVSKQPLGDSLEKIVSFKGDPKDGCALARSLLGAAQVTQVARDTGISRYTLMRWQQNKSEPALHEVLQIMHHCQYMMLEFIAHLVDISTVPEAWGVYEMRQRRKEVYYELPVAAAILCCLKLDEYKQLPAHQTGYIANKIGISLGEEQEALERLIDVGKVTKNGEHFEALEEQLELTDSESFRSFSTYWLGRAKEFCETTENPMPVIGYGMDIHPTSKKTFKALRDEYCAFYKRVRALLAQDAGNKDSIYVFQSLFFDLERRHEESPKNCRVPIRKHREKEPPTL
jgi:transcriptional regulator with XRE-family HTH domain